jgi:hypothetical protein
MVNANAISHYGMKREGGGFFRIRFGNAGGENKILV